MGTNGDVFLVERLRSEFEIMHNIRGNTEALCQRLKHMSIRIVTVRA
jgi:hypothetical protein